MNGTRERTTTWDGAGGTRQLLRALTKPHSHLHGTVHVPPVVPYLSRYYVRSTTTSSTLRGLKDSEGENRGCRDTGIETAPGPINKVRGRRRRAQPRQFSLFRFAGVCLPLVGRTRGHIGTVLIGVASLRPGLAVSTRRSSALWMLWGGAVIRRARHPKGERWACRLASSVGRPETRSKLR